MDTTKLCSECGKPLAFDAPLGRCPECMLKAGLASPAAATIKVAPNAFVEPSETETKEFAPGTKLGYFGDYELLEEIARGGMGVVYKARQTSLKRIVAVKMIRSGALADETEVARFRAEAQAAAQLQHPNIVAIHEIGEHEGRHYFSMDFVEGKNLAQIAGSKPVTPQKAAEWLKPIAGAVQFAHQRGVLHRDLKPQNIMVDAEGRPRVTDFGLAKNLAGDSTLTQTGAVMGSPSYMPPEQARGRNDLIGPASDVYSLGTILYELLTGRPPFQGKSLVETLSMVVNDEPRSPRKLNPGTPVDLETICLKCLEKEPVRRYPTARELELDLGRFLAGEPVLARPAGALRKLKRWSRRHRSQFNVAVSVLIFSLTGLAYGFWEETRYLNWLVAHPGAAKDVGARGYEPIGLYFARHFGHWPPSHSFSRDEELVALMGLEWMFLVLLPLVKVGYRKLTPMGHPAAPWVALTFGAPAVVGVAGALYLATDVIQVTIWEGPESFELRLIGRFGLLLLLFASWLGMLLEIIRQQRRKPVDPGLEGEEAGLTPEQLASIHTALAAGNIRRAANRYRAATQTPFYEAQERVLDIAARRMAAEDIAAIHQEIYAGRIHKAIKLFRAPTPASKTVAQKPILQRFRLRLSSRPAKMQKRFAHQAVMRIAKQLYRAHPEKFASGKPGGIKANPAGRRWRWLGISWLLMLFEGFLPPGVGTQLIWLLVAIAAGAFTRIARWKEMYRERRRSLRVVAWVFLVVELSSIVEDAWAWFSLLILKTGPISVWTGKTEPNFDTTCPYLPGLIIGWLLMQLWLGRRSVSAKTGNQQQIARMIPIEAQSSKK